MKTLFLLVTGLLLLNSCEPLTDSHTDNRTDNNLKTAEVDAEQWNYEQDADKMTSKINYIAHNTSVNVLSFQWPYSGFNKGHIVVRKRRGTTDVYIEIDKGQFISGVYGTTIKARFDKRKAMVFSTQRSSDYNPTILFIVPASRFIANLKKSKHAIIEATFYQAGDQQLEFNTDGLKWEH